MSDTAWIVIGIVGFGVAVYVSGTRNPLTKCRRCGGSGLIRSWLLPWRYRPCPRCGRAGEIRGRLGRRD
ncbi:MAG: hypothetical protein JWO11_868 [Nocardioides sp.]|nr:hypothetical protein [Nocardioides sp.]